MVGKSNIFGKTALILALLAILTGCAKTEIYVSDNDPVSISFDSYHRRATKADGSYVSGSTIPDGGKFAVYSWYHENSNWATDNPMAPNFMYHEEVTRSGDNYNYSPLRYWPYNEENKLSFWAYYPYSAYVSGNTGQLAFYETDKTSTYTSTSATGLPYAVFTVDSDPTAQIDLMFSDLKKDQIRPAGNEPVNLLFSHVLSRVVFKAISKAPIGTDIVINSLTVKDVIIKGGLQTQETVSSASWELQPTQKSDFDLDVVSTAVPNENAGEEAAVITTSGQELMMLPQDLDDADHTIQAEVTYSITPPSGVTGHAVSRTSTVLLSSSTLTAWTKGKIITYTLVLSSENLIWFSAETSWDSTGAMDETIIVE